MTSTTSSHQVREADAARFIEAARTGDASAFAALTERYRRELHVHCYRMVASFEDAQDLTQDVLLRAWRYRESFEGRASLRTWLYRIATNACLDFLARRPDRFASPSTTQEGAPAEVTYLQPYPDRLLDEMAADGDPGQDLVARETIELAFLVAIQHLPPRQRAVLVLRDVLGWRASDAAATLDTSVAAVNSALQRARVTMRQHVPDRRMDWRSSTDELTDDERTLLARYVQAHTDDDIEGLTALLAEDLTFAMPPEHGSWIGRDRIVADWVEGGFGAPWFGQWRCLLTRANRQPAVVSYLRRPDDDAYRVFAIDVLTIEDGLVTDVTAFPMADGAPYGLPDVLEADTT